MLGMFSIKEPVRMQTRTRAVCLFPRLATPYHYLAPRLPGVVRPTAVKYGHAPPPPVHHCTD